MYPFKINQAEVAYKNALRLVRYGELIIGFLALIFMIVVPEVRVQLEAKTPLETLVFLLFELILYFSVRGLVGVSHLPGNYICALFMKCFIFYDTQYKSKLHDSKASWLDAVMLLNLKGTLKDSLAWERPFFTFFSPLILFPVITLFTNIYVGDYEVSSLLGTTLSTTLAMGILVSSMGIERFGESGIIFHFRICLIWAYFTSIMTFFNILFLTQRAWRYNQGRMSSRRFSRTLIEIMIYFISIYLMIHYVPIIHSNFTIHNMYTIAIPDLIIQIIPTTLKCIFYQCPKLNIFQRILELNWFKYYKYFCPVDLSIEE